MDQPPLDFNFTVPDGFPALAPFEKRVFMIFVRRHRPGFASRPVQLQGDKQIHRVAAGCRLEKKGLLCRWDATNWHPTKLGEKLAEHILAEFARPDEKT